MFRSFDSADAVKGAWNFIGDGDIEWFFGGYGSDVGPVDQVVAAFEDDRAGDIRDGESHAPRLELLDEAREVKGVLIQGEDEVTGGALVTGNADAIFGASDRIKNERAGLPSGGVVVIGCDQIQAEKICAGVNGEDGVEVAPFGGHVDRAGKRSDPAIPDRPLKSKLTTLIQRSWLVRFAGCANGIHICESRGADESGCFAE